VQCWPGGTTPPDPRSWGHCAGEPPGCCQGDTESLRDAAARELYEETRISMDPAQLGEPIAQNTIEFSWGGHHIVQDQTFYAVLVTSAEVSLDGLDP
jgi:ADP-ribose pyrophosphatase YjhB (NUDIX family)